MQNKKYKRGTYLHTYLNQFLNFLACFVNIFNINEENVLFDFELKIEQFLAHSFELFQFIK